MLIEEGGREERDQGRQRIYPARKKDVYMVLSKKGGGKSKGRKGALQAQEEANPHLGGKIPTEPWVGKEGETDG